jgi:hypothetical protein
MATALKLKKDITKLKAAISSKATPKSFIPKLKSQLEKAEAEYSAVKLGKKTKKTTTKATATSLSKLQDLIKKKKYGTYKGAGVDLEKDADRPALPTGKRISKNGNRYYEYRANRIDVKQPPKKYPKLEKGGETDDKVRFDMYGYMDINNRTQDGDEIIRVNSYKEAEEKAQKYLKDNSYELVELYRKDDFVGSIRTKGNFVYSTKYKKEDFASGGYMAKGGDVGIELMGGQSNSELKPSGYKLISKKGNEIIVSDDGGQTKERYVKNKYGVSGYRLVYNGNDYEFTDSFKEGGYMAKGGEVKVGDTLTATTGVKVKVVEFDPAFGGRVKVERLDEYATSKPSQWMPLKKFNFASGGYMADGGELHRTQEKYAMGGALEHGLKEGDHIMVVKGNILGIKNEETGEFATLDISTGERNDAPHLKESLGLMKYYSRNKE